MKKLLQFTSLFLVACTFEASATPEVIEFDTEQAMLITTQQLSEKEVKKHLEEVAVQEKEQKILKFVKIHKNGLKNQKLFSFVDYSMPISEKRLFIFDLRSKKIVFSAFVGHSHYSGEETPVNNSNVPNTRKTSLGLYRIGVQYYGKFGKSKRLHGLSASNSNAFKRAIVAHSMVGDKVEDLYSWGCFTFFEKDLDKIFNFMKKDTYLLAVGSE